MNDKIEDIVVPLLKNIQADITWLRSDVAELKEHTGKIDTRLQSVEAHMSGFMSSARDLESEINELRGRVKALEEINGDQPSR